MPLAFGIVLQEGETVVTCEGYIFQCNENGLYPYYALPEDFFERIYSEMTIYNTLSQYKRELLEMLKKDCQKLKSRILKFNNCVVQYHNIIQFESNPGLRLPKLVMEMDKRHFKIQNILSIIKDNFMEYDRRS